MTMSLEKSCAISDDSAESCTDEDVDIRGQTCAELMHSLILRGNVCAEI